MLMPSRKSNAPKKVAPVRVRMIDIAREAGVSRPLVSFVLGGGKHGERVSMKTAAKIRGIAQRLNFHPNHAARQLAGKRSNIIGALAKTWSWATESRALGWLNQLASNRGFKILGWQIDGLPGSLDRAIDECLGWNIDGLAFMAFKYDAIWPEVARAAARLPRVVSLLGNPGIPGGFSVEIDVADGVRQSVEHCFQQGRRRIVQVLEGRRSQMDVQRFDAFQEAHRAFYGKPDQDQVCFATAGWKVEDYEKYDELGRQLVVDRKADAVLAESDFSAPGLVRAWNKLGYRVGEEVALIGWGDEMVGRGVIPALTTVDFNFPEIVSKALDLLSDLVERPDDPRPESVVIKPKLVVRESA
jgi:DNA-binding LacI/PurR family transcriptional regulator